jgi:hypothetical protein
LETNTIIPQGLAFQLAQQGIDNGMLSGKPVAPLNINLGGPPGPQPPPGPPGPPRPPSPQVVPPDQKYTDDEVKQLDPGKLSAYGEVLAKYRNFPSLRDFILNQRPGAKKKPADYLRQPGKLLKAVLALKNNRPLN